MPVDVAILEKLVEIAGDTQAQGTTALAKESGGNLATLAGKDFATQVTLAALLTELQAKADLVETQPISAASLPLPSGAATAANQQTDALTNTQLRATAVPVSGTFWQATQPVSGTFWQATQPVSGPLTDTELRATAVPISVASLPLPTGAATQTTLASLLTELQLKADLTETQPVSIATMPSTPVTGTFWQATQPVSGTFWQATQPVSLATAPSTPVTNVGTFAVQATLPNDQGKTLVSKGGSAASSGNNTLVAAGTNRLKVYAFSLSTTSTTAVTCIFQSGAGGTELWRVVLQAPTSVSTGANIVVQPPAWLFATASATLLNLNLSSAQTIHWSVSYWDEA